MEKLAAAGAMLAIALACTAAAARNVKVTAFGSQVKPASVLITHPNEAVTEGGKLRAESRAAGLVKMLRMPAHLALSGRTVEFDGKGKCVAGC